MIKFAKFTEREIIERYIIKELLRQKCIEIFLKDNTRTDRREYCWERRYGYK